MFDKYDVLAVIAPVAAPIAPATMLINILYAELMREAVNQNFAIGAAVASGIGAEASGMIAAYVGIQAYRKKKYGLMAVAIFAFVSYAAFMALGISAARNPIAMISTIIISIIAYVSVAILADLRGIIVEIKAETDLRVKEMDAQRKLTNAQTRNAKAGVIGNFSENIGNLPAIPEMRWNEVQRKDYAKIAQSSTAEICREYGVTERTARNWRHNAQEAK